MSSAFTDQPSPNDPRHEEGYTPTPPAPERGWEDDDDDRPKLGSLAQKARGKQLKQVRVLLFVLGGLIIVVNLFSISTIRSNYRKAVDAEIQKRGGPAMVPIDRAAIQLEEDNTFLLGSSIRGAFVLLGVLFLLFGAILYRYPVPVTVLSLLLYLLGTVAGIAIVAIGDPDQLGKQSAFAWLERIFFVVALASSIKLARTYERERQAEKALSSVQ